MMMRLIVINIIYVIVIVNGIVIANAIIVVILDHKTIDHINYHND